MILEFWIAHLACGQLAGLMQQCYRESDLQMIAAASASSLMTLGLFIPLSRE